MKRLMKTGRIVSAVIALTWALLSFGNEESQGESLHVDLYKSETCGCCHLWQEHLQDSGYSVTVHHPKDLNSVKQKYNIAPQFQSCHTAVHEDYVFEGHVPEKFVKQFLANPPSGAIGLAVPGMPLGSPGMEVGDRFTPYDILLLKKDGNVETYAQIKSLADQY